MKIDRALLVGAWLHSHEEDEADKRVYRPAGFAFPPSRGRSGFDLAADGSLRERRIGATDAPAAASGTWRLEDSALVLSADGGDKRLRIVRAAADKLVVRR